MWWKMPSPDVIHINTRLDDSTLLDLSTANVEKGEPVVFSTYAKAEKPTKAPDGTPHKHSLLTWGTQLERAG
jgi:hypothetical protein